MLHQFPLPFLDINRTGRGQATSSKTPSMGEAEHSKTHLEDLFGINPHGHVNKLFAIVKDATILNGF